MVRLTLASLVVALAVSSNKATWAGSANISTEKTRHADALVVLIGDAASDELRSVLSELLERQGVAVDYEARPRFSSRALLSESRDTRVWVFISEAGPHVAKLYFRGPSGERFLLRQLALKDGLDELGRELIGQVVETSTVALLRSEAGVSRDEARAGLSAEDDETSSDASTSAKVEAPRANAAGTAPSPLEYQLDAVFFAKWSGPDLGVDHGVGAETAIAFYVTRRLFLRGRIGVEVGFGQSIETNGLDAEVHTTSLRGGIDLGTAAGIHAFSLGAIPGVDFTNVAPKASADPSFRLAGESRGTVPVVRLEARYELSLGAFRAAASVFGDAALTSTRYEIQDEAGEHRVARPWAFRPGLALSLGGRTNL